MYVEIVEESKKRSLAIAINPVHHFLVDDLGALADSEGAPITAGAFRVLIEQGSKTELAKHALDQAMLAALEIETRKLPAVERPHERVARRMKIVFEVDKAPAKTQVSREVGPVGRECPGAIPSVLHRLSQCGEAAHAFI